MDIYNPLISRVKELVPESVKEYPYNPSNCWKDIGSSELVLQKDAAFELGASGKGSANFILFTSDPKLVDGDKIIVAGKDIGEINGDCDFARIVLLRVGVMDEEDEVVYRTLKDIEFAKYHVYPEGYMVRMSPESYREQIRVSRTAVRQGISFSKLGNNYIKEYKKDINVLSAQVIFITDPSVDYAELKNLAKKSTDVTSTLTHIMEGFSTDCSVCSLKDICDEVEGLKELHFGVGEKGHKD